VAKKRQFQDSTQESAVASESNQTSNWTEIRGNELRMGDQIVVAVNQRTGKAVRSHAVKKIEYHVRGCGNVHVNDTECYDSVGFVKVRV
jgi:hypothetical protein